MGGVTSIRSNAVPVGGVTALQPAPPTPVPADIESLVEYLTPVITRFRRASLPMQVDLDQQTLTDGQQNSVRITSVGLGYRIVRKHVSTFSLVNANTAAAVAKISPWAPYNLENNVTVTLNGGAVTYSADGPSTLLVSQRTRRGALAQNPSTGAMSGALVSVTSDANATLTASTATGQLSGYDSVSIAASSTGTVTMTWFEVIKLALSRNTLLGALPLQNNSVFAQLQTTLGQSGASSSTKQGTPFYDVAAGLTVTVSDVISATYEFWSVPTDPTLYAPLVANSYQVQQQKAIVTASSGAEAFKYNLPQNTYLLTAHFLSTDSTGAYIVASGDQMGGFTLARLIYNGGSIRPVQLHPGRHRALQFSDYGADLGLLPGYFLWDGENTADDLSESDQAGWVDTYAAATPQFSNDVASSVSLNMTTSITRETVIPGAVQTIG